MEKHDGDVVEDDNAVAEKKKQKKKSKKKTKKKRKKSQETTPEPLAMERKGVHFELQKNTEQSVKEAKKALRTPRPPTRNIKPPTSGILKKVYPATDPLKRSTGVVPKTPRRSLRKKKKRRL